MKLREVNDSEAPVETQRNITSTTKTIQIDGMSVELPSLDVEELDDGSVALYLTRGSLKGTRVVLREADANDLQAIEKVKAGNIEKALRLVARVCTNWGDKPGITYPQLIEPGFLRAKDATLLGRVVSEYFL